MRQDHFRGRIILEIIKTRLFDVVALLPELVPLPLLGLGDLRHHQLFSSQLLEQLLQDLQTILLVLSTNMSFTIKTTIIVRIWINIAAPSLSSSYRYWSPGRRRDPPRCLGQWSSQSAARRSPTRSGCWDWGLDQTLFVWFKNWKSSVFVRWMMGTRS